MRKTDNLGGITAFVTTAQQGSFTAAAELLGLTKSAVGKSVSRLEARLGLTLFLRSTRRLSLTPDGEVFLCRCQQAIDILEQAEAELTAHVIHPTAGFGLTCRRPSVGNVFSPSCWRLPSATLSCR